MVTYKVSTDSIVEPISKSQVVPVLLLWWEMVWYRFPVVLEFSSGKIG